MYVCIIVCVVEPLAAKAQYTYMTILSPRRMYVYAHEPTVHC